MPDAPAPLTVWPLTGIGEIGPGTDLVEEIVAASAGTLRDGDILVVTSKIVSKAEGRYRPAADRDAAIAEESVRVVAENEAGTVRIVESRLGIVAAAAGVDASNTPEGLILLLPEDPDASARALAVGIRERTAARIGVIVSDTLGRAWREGQTDCAIGAAGVVVIEDLRGATDASGRPLAVTLPCVADELAGAADLVKRKSSGMPVAVVRGRGDLVGDLDLPGARSIVRPAERDLFGEGTREAYARGFSDGATTSGG
ncbi:coenzyme F420-0:L-glutamate ligase [Microbacterium oleivorans]|uniref:coenzyme F420-0:L-glutamate ligase n=1 Tax=Microbacterium oleivorans TaxID=273677 RepID=UPI00203E6002|nr:coenzyme F420-0:L-glutamate ligase [Microbacterium oleivorans]MCM3695527.1 coenzyme F420-0:L-glutamate ligase [Microbacterium oleivorans]